MRATLITLINAAVVLFASARTVAQEPDRRVSLDEAVRLFNQNSLSLRMARSDAHAAQGDARQSRSYFNPAFTAVREDLSGDGDDYWETTIGLQQRLEWPGRTAARSRAAEHRITGAMAAFEADSARLAFQVRRTYAEAWGSEEQEAAVGRSAVAIRMATQAAESRFAEGDISGYELRRLRVELARVGQALATASLQVKVSRRSLATLILPETDVDEIGPDDTLGGRPPTVSREAAFAALASRPDILAAERALAATEADVSVAAQAWVPSPVVSIGFKDQADGLSGATFGFAVPIPLFDRGGGARAAAGARREAASADLTLRRREAENDLRTAFDRHKLWRSRLTAMGDRFTADADALLEIAREAYDAGELELIELLDAVRAFQGARSAAIELRERTWIAYFDLLRAMGRAPENDR